MRDAGIADRVMRELITEKKRQIAELEAEITQIEKALVLLWEEVR